MNINAQTKICMVIGDPVEHSLSPQMHNAGYEALHIDDTYVYVACHVDVKNIENFINGVRSMGIRGISCTIPHKIAVIPFLDKVDETAKKIGAVNTIINDNGILKGHNTDWLGVSESLKKIISLKGKKVALLGAGGAARAAAYAVIMSGADLMIFNRTLENAQKLAKEFGGVEHSLEKIEKVKYADIIINTTSVGLEKQNETPISKEYINKNQVVFDLVYGKNETQLIKDAKENGAKTLSGIDMLLHQGFAQFKLFTGHEAPESAMRNALI